MNFKGEDLEAGLVDWVKSEIKETPKQSYDLGKFFFTVSIGTVGAIATLEKLNQTSAIDTPMITSLVALFLSMLIALDLARPRKLKIDGSTDLQKAYQDQIEKVLFRMGLWFTSWFVGTLFGGYAIHN
jgi:hypothetical protein